MFKNKLLYALVISSLFYSCLFAYDPPRKLISIKNNSESIIYLYWSCDDTMRWYYPPIYEMELSIEKSDKLKNIPLYYKIYPDSIDFLHTGSYERWEIFDICSVNEIYVFFIADSIMQKEGWNNIVKKQLYTKKESFTMEQLEKQRWIIEYP